MIKSPIKNNVTHKELNTNHSKYVDKEKNYESYNHQQQNYQQQKYQQQKYQQQNYQMHNNTGTNMGIQQMTGFPQKNQGHNQYNPHLQQQQQQQDMGGFYQNYGQQQSRMNTNNLYNSKPYYSK